MSDEERLERIIRESKGVVWNTETDEDLLTELDTPDFNWLIKQAERNVTAQETVEILGESLKQSIEQNKRYREFLEDMYNHAYGLQLYPHVVDEIKKLLEESE